MSKLKRKIRDGLKKDSNVLLESLQVSSSDPDSIRQSVTEISNLLDKEKEFTKDRKELSRKIGVVKADGGDASELIASVSGISQKLKNLEADIDVLVEGIAANIQTEKTTSEAVVAVPAHLVVVDQKLNCDVDQLILECKDQIDIAEWQGFVESQSHATIYHDARWHRLLKLNFGHLPHYITCRQSDGTLCGVFPTIHLNSKLFGSFMVSMPYFNYGGPLTQYPVVANRMMEFASELGENLECTHFEARDTQKREPWLCKDHKVTMILPLPETDEQLDQQLGTKVRAQVNRAAKEDLEFAVGGTELLAEFYQVFSHNMRDLGTPVYSKKFFASILASFDKEASLAVVRHEGKPVAAGFLLGFNDKLEIPWASSLRKANPLGANMYMYRQILSVAIKSQYKFFDFGRSSKGASTYRYKKQWGALEHPLYWHYWLRDSDELPELNPDNPKYKLAISVWQKLPVAVANIIGPMLVRNLP